MRSNKRSVRFPSLISKALLNRDFKKDFLPGKRNSYRMNGFIFAFAVSYFIISSIGQCPPNVGYLAVTSCDGSTKNGPYIYIDFYKINRPCYCTVITSFNGDLLVTSMKGIGRICKTQVTVVTVYNYRYMFNCQASEVSAVLHVNINQSVSVLAEYSSLSTSGAFYHCLRFDENGGLGGNLSVVCGSNHSAETTSMETSTTTASSTTRLISTTSELSSVELITTSAINENISDATGSTAATLSEENKCDSLIAESLLSLQISLALFVMISTVSTILNIYFYRYIKTRKKSWNGKSNSKDIKDHRSGAANSAETYTELGNTVSGESENQYDSISRQENYINTNVF